MNVQEQIERTRQVIHRYFSEVWNEGRLQVLDELLTPDYINHSPSTPDPERGPRGLKPIVAAMRVGIPDLHYTILDAVLEPDKAAVHVRLTGTHTGELFGMAPTNRSIDVRQMRIEWLRDGRICEHWRITQELDLLRQLGLDGAAGSGDPMHTTARLSSSRSAPAARCLTEVQCAIRRHDPFHGPSSFLPAS